MPTTNYGKYKAVVKEFGDGTPFIQFELLSGSEIPAFRRANIGLSFEDGTSYEEVSLIAGAINDKLSGLFFTDFG